MPQPALSILSEIVPFVLSAAVLLAVACVPLWMVLRYLRLRSEQTHTERMKAMEMGCLLNTLDPPKEQMHFMCKNLYSENKIKTLQTFFLEAYFGKKMTDLTDDEYSRLNLYQSWNALRGFMYFFFQEKVREQSYGLLEEAWLYLTLARDHQRTIFIKFNI